LVKYIFFQFCFSQNGKKLVTKINKSLEGGETYHGIGLGFIGVAYQGKKDIVFRFIIEYSSLRDFGPY